MNTEDKMRQLLEDAAVMFRNIRRARNLPPQAQALNQYIVMGYDIDKFLRDNPRPRRHKLDVGQCICCDEFHKEGTDFHPSHDASASCLSGKRTHCSCDECF